MTLRRFGLIILINLRITIEASFNSIPICNFFNRIYLVTKFHFIIIILDYEILWSGLLRFCFDALILITMSSFAFVSMLIIFDSSPMFSTSEIIFSLCNKATTIYIQTILKETTVVLFIILCKLIISIKYLASLFFNSL